MSQLEMEIQQCSRRIEALKADNDRLRSRIGSLREIIADALSKREQLAGLQQELTSIAARTVSCRTESSLLRQLEDDVRSLAYGGLATEADDGLSSSVGQAESEIGLADEQIARNDNEIYHLEDKIRQKRAMQAEGLS